MKTDNSNNVISINDISDIKKKFPLLNKKIDGKIITYLDSAASSQKPEGVINDIKHNYENNYANVHRGIYKLSQIATDKYERSREKIAKFLNANSSKEIIFTRGATEGINLVASSLADGVIRDADEIIISTLEHHSNIIPWQILAKKTGAKIVELKPDSKGNISMDNLKSCTSNKTKIISLPHITNSIGSILPVEEICSYARQKGIITLIDGCQAAPHIEINLNKIQPDFYVLSGHKVYGPSGIGVLYGKQEWLEKLNPYQTGGEMIDYVSIHEATFADIPNKFEAGTPNIVGAISLSSATDFIKDIGINNITEHSRFLTKTLCERFRELNFIKIIGDPDNRLGIVSFLVQGSHPHDVALLLDNRGISIRAGHHCAQPAMRHFNVDTTLRVSFGVYNNEEDIDNFILNLKDVIKYF